MSPETGRFKLTEREADVAVLLTEDMPIVEMAHHLSFRVATLRSYLKSVFEKTGTTRQVQRAALLDRLRP